MDDLGVSPFMETHMLSFRAIYTCIQEPRNPGCIPRSTETSQKPLTKLNSISSGHIWDFHQWGTPKRLVYVRVNPIDRNG